MANNIIVPSLIAREAMMNLKNNLVLGGLVNRDFDNEFFAGSGSTVNVVRPTTFEADEFDTAINVQDIKESIVDVKLDKLLDVSFSVTEKEMSLDLTHFSERYIQPAVDALVQKVDRSIAMLALDVPYFTGTAGTAPNDVSSITGVRKVMNDNKVPLNGRKLVMDTAADAKLLELDAFNRVDASGTPLALVDAQLGRKFGYDCYFDQNIVMHNNGDIAFAGTPTLATIVSPGADTMVFTDSSVTGTIKKGTLFTVAGSNQQFVITEDAVAAGSTVTVKVSPAVIDGLASGAAVTIVPNHTKNIAFHKNAFTLVNRPLEQVKGTDECAVFSAGGLSLRVVIDYNSTNKKRTVSIDSLFGFKTLDPTLACVLLG